MLALRLEEKEKGAESRTAIVAAVKQKKKSSASKKSRRKYKALDAAKSAVGGETPVVEGNEPSVDAGASEDHK